MGEVELKTIVIYVGSQTDYNLFSRFANAIESLQYSIVFITPKLSLFIIAKLSGYNCYLVRYSINTIPNEEVLQTSEVASNVMETKIASAFYNGVQETVATINAKKRIDIIAVWNGLSVPTKSLTDFARNNGLNTLFFELANIPGKIFIDPLGVNSRSLLFSSPNILAKFDQNKEIDYEKWRNNYLLQKKNEITTPTARSEKKINNYLFLLDVFGTSWMRLPSIGSMNIISKIKEKLLNRKYKITGDVYDLLSKKYIFFPMQVSNDTQLLFNSSLSNYDGIAYCIEKAKQKNCDVVVKPHPVENNISVFHQLNDFRKLSHFFIVTEPTMKIIENAEEVVTLNSTVGLEALIANKKVTFLGQTFYSFLKGTMLPSYIMEYLIDVDYYSKNKIPSYIAQRIVERAYLQ